MTTLRTEGGTYAPGASGNPAGMKPGTKHARTLMAEAFQANGEAIAHVVIEKALKGDLMAAALVLQRLVPPKRPTSEKTPFALDTRLPLAQQAAQVVQAVADGHLSADDAQTVLGCLSTYAAIVQADEMTRRLEALERRFGGHRTAAYPMTEVRPYASPDGKQLPQLPPHGREPALSAPSGGDREWRHREPARSGSAA